MDADSTPNNILLAKQLIQDFSDRITFQKGDDFVWSPQEKTIYYTSITSSENLWALMHEIGHAVLEHRGYSFDIQLLTIEAAAWQYAQEILASRYAIIIEPEHIQLTLDNYRDWLHQRSTCPNCRHNGIQTKANTYSCFNCRCLWRVNDARKKGLKRVKITQQFL